MSVIAALKREEKKWLRQADEAKQQLDTIYAAMKLLRGKASGTGRKRRRMSAATRKKMAAAAKARWAKARKANA